MNQLTLNNSHEPETFCCFLRKFNKTMEDIIFSEIDRTLERFRVNHLRHTRREFSVPKIVIFSQFQVYLSKTI